MYTERHGGFAGNPFQHDDRMEEDVHDANNQEDCRMKRYFSALIEREDDMYVALCPELDIASQGNSIEEAKSNLAEAVELFMETADETEIAGRLHTETYLTNFEVTVGQA